MRPQPARPPHWGTTKPGRGQRCPPPGGHGHVFAVLEDLHAEDAGHHLQIVLLEQVTLEAGGGGALTEGGPGSVAGAESPSTTTT